MHSSTQKTPSIRRRSHPFSFSFSHVYTHSANLFDVLISFSRAHSANLFDIFVLILVHTVQTSLILILSTYSNRSHLLSKRCLLAVTVTRSLLQWLMAKISHRDKPSFNYYSKRCFIGCDKARDTPSPPWLIDCLIPGVLHFPVILTRSL